MSCPAAPATLRRAARRWLEQAPQRLIESLLPRHCLLCGQPAGATELCAPCRADLPRLGPACSGCALPLAAAGDPSADPDAGPGDLLCGRCLSRPPPWDQALAALRYRFPADRLVCRFKFSRDLAAGALLGRELLNAIRRSGQALPDAIVPVPLHRTRHFSRTFNQAELLARQLGRALDIPVHSRLLARSRRTLAQSGLDAAGRRRNIRGAFRLAIGSEGLPCQGHIALVDDVLTTGVTLAECSRTLRRAGIARISVWVAARAPIP